jgi:APA family basic amino acid/polyamine antiporter
MKSGLFKTKPIQTILSEISANEHGFKRTLTATSLTTLGIGSVIGAGIFVLTGQAAAQYAGPAIVFSFIIAGLACALAGLCYAEFASMIPISGSAYTYAYATLGELLAWIIGWDLVLQYLFAASSVAVGWSDYTMSFLLDFGISIPPQFTAAWNTVLVEVPDIGWKPISENLINDLSFAGLSIDSLPHINTICNLPAMFIVAFFTILLVLGIKESASFNNLMVVIKVSLIILFIGLGFMFVKAGNWDPFIPKNTGVWGQFGWSGILRGAGVIFFAYVGFDAASTVAQEAKNPKRDVPVGILSSLGISTVLYILMAIVLTGMVSYTRLNVADPVAVGVNSMGDKMFWLRPIIKIAALAGLSSVILVTLMGQARIFHSMSNDGLLPPAFSKLHSRFKTPYLSTIITGIVGLTLAGVFPLNILGELVSIGTLLAFVIVCISILVLRKTRPDIPRPFRTPWVPLVPVLGTVICLVQMFALPFDTWIRLIIWFAIGLIIYFIFGRKNSKLNPPACSASEDKKNN